VHREIKENLATTNASWLNRTRCGLSDRPVFGEASDLEGSYELQAELYEEAIRGMSGFEMTATGAQSGDPEKSWTFRAAKRTKSLGNTCGTGDEFEGAQPSCVIVDIGHDHEFVGTCFRNERIDA
jgi:hypothetical protein